MPNNFNLDDALLKQSKALPAAAGSTTSNGIDLMNSATGDFVAEVDLTIDAPALTVTQLPNAATATYLLEHDTDPAFGTVTTLATLGTQTGAGGVGAAAVQFRFDPPETVKRYVRGKCTTATSPGDCSAASFTLKVKS
jgi:hypothetical protein